MGPTEGHELEDAPQGRPRNGWEHPILNCVSGAYDECSKGVWKHALFPVSQREGARLTQLLHSNTLPEAIQRA